MKNKQEFFSVLRVSRDDFAATGYDASGLNDMQMERIGEKMGEHLTESGAFWDLVEFYAEDFKLKSIGNGQRKDD